METVTYSPQTKHNCWYKSICNKEFCADGCLCQRHYKMSILTDLANLEGNQKHSISLKPEQVDLEAFKRLKDIKTNINDFVSKGKNLLIYSEHTGNGKTEWSKKLLLSWFDSIWSKTDFVCRGLFISMPKLMQSLKNNISKEDSYFMYVNDLIESVDLVIWDELNYKDLTQFEHDYLLTVISHRLAVGKSNVYTTNYDLKTIESKLGSRLSSRIIGASELVELKGLDKRGWCKDGN